MTGKSFTYTTTHWDEQRKTASFYFVLETNVQTFQLCETITFPLPVPDLPETASLLKALHLALGISYYKAFIPPEIKHPYQMGAAEADYWNTVFSEGLGEFLYIHKLPSERLATFSEQTGAVTPRGGTWEPDNTAILGIGGGKDSIVAGELLQSSGVPIAGFVLATGEALGQSQAVAETMKIALHAVERRIDRQILEINQLEGALNGHVPISLVFALTGSILAIATRTSYVVVANEASSSLPQAQHEQTTINHQWSKSLQFERLFQDYLRAYVSPHLRYFSAIRPLSSVAVMKLFARYPQFYEVFTSDNSLFKIDPGEREHPRWSLDSNKSLSSYILISPFVSRDELLKIFGRDFTKEKLLVEAARRLLGEGEPILDCVGTPDELRACLRAGIDNGSIAADSAIAQACEDLLEQARPIDDFYRLEQHAYPPTLENKLITTLETWL